MRKNDVGKICRAHDTPDHLDTRRVTWYNLFMKRQDAMQAILQLACGVFFLFITSACPATVINFDDLNPGFGARIVSPYQGLSWSNFAAINGILQTNGNGVSGYGYGVVSPSNAAFNNDGRPAEIDARGTNFNFLSAYFTGAWNSNLNIEVEGFNGTNLLYDQTVVASATNATLFTFNYMDIDRLYFNSFGGQRAFSFDGGTYFVMDNFTFESVPEPSTMLLAGFGALMLWPFLKRRRS